MLTPRMFMQLIFLFRYSEANPNLVCNLIDKKLISVLYLIFMTEMIIFKAKVVVYTLNYIDYISPLYECIPQSQFSLLFFKHKNKHQI